MNKIREYFWEYLFLFLLIVFAVSITALLISMQQEAPEINHVGAVFIGEVDDAGWNQRHYDALKQLCADVSLPFDIIENIDESHDSAGAAITELVQKDCNIIFLTSDGFNNSLNDIYEKYPDISFYTVSPDCDADNVVSYFGRMYQARYLSGILAGGTTKSNILGYVAGDDNIQVTRGINAFLMGARSINPDAVVEVKYTGSWDDAAAEQEAVRLLAQDCGADVITYHNSYEYSVEAAESYGVYSIGYNSYNLDHSDKYLTCVEFNWYPVYRNLITDYLKGDNTAEYYWADVSDDAVNLTDISPAVSADTKEALDAAYSSLLSGQDVFMNEIYSNDGNLMCSDNERISDYALLHNMDWYVKGVEIYE